VRDNKSMGKVQTVEATYLVQPLEFHPDLFYYGIHGVEALYAVMGTGCTTLSRRIDAGLDVTTCTWKDGRTGVFRGLPKADATQPLIKIAGDKGSAATAGAADNEGIVRAIAEFFHTGRAPVDVAQTIEVFEFMTAAQLSKQRGGAEVKLSELRK
jgi:hypothetical protein